MPTRFDHLVIGVRDLEKAIQHYQRLGFDVRPGGKHTGRGTHNALIRFGLDYIELLSVYDEAEARASNWQGISFVDLLERHEELLLGYALATETIEQEAGRFLDDNELANDIFAMRRARPDGQVLSWRLFVPGGVSWRRPWPFIIQWDTPDSERLLVEQPGVQPNGVIAWTGVTVAARYPGQATELYQQRLGLNEEGVNIIDIDQRLTAHHTSFSVKNSRIDLVSPTGAGAVQKTLAEIGEGPFEVRLAVNNLGQTRQYFAQTGIALLEKQAEPGELLIDPQETFGIKFFLYEAATKETVSL